MQAYLDARGLVELMRQYGMPRDSAALGWMRRLRLRGLSRRADGLDWLIGAAAALGAALVLARTLPHGVGLTLDSLHYIEVARNVLAGEGFVNHDGAIHTIWPPGYPILLAVAGLGIIDPHSIAAPLNAVLFGLTIFAVGRYLRARLEMGFLALWACLAIALAPPLADVARYALSGMPFILFMTLALIQTDRALWDDRWTALAWAAIFCALSWQTRYIGAAVPALAGLALLLQGGMPLSRRLRRAAFFAAVVGAPMALWMLRNYLARGTLLYEDNRFSLSEILRDGAQILASWGQPLPGWLFALVLATLILSLFISMSRGSRRWAWRACLIFGGFGLAYAALISAAIDLGYPVPSVHPRFVAPLYIPLVVIAVFALDGLFGWASATSRPPSAGRLPIIRTFVWGGVFRLDRLLAIALGGGLCAWIALQAVANADHIARANSGALYLGYASQRWTESDTMRYLRDNLSGATIYTNDPEPAHFHSGGNANYIHWFNKVFRADTSSPWQFTQRWAARNHGAYVVWLDDGKPPGSISVIGMRVREGLEPVAEFADGAVFRVNGEYKPNPSASPYFSAYSAIARGEVARSSPGEGFEVYVHENTLIYFKHPCDIEDVQARFFLHVFPESVADLPDVRREYGFENLGFEFTRRGALFGDNCVAVTPLPLYESERVSTGQRVRGGGALWKADVAGTGRIRQAHKAATDGDYGSAVARSNFDIYLDEDAESKTLVYIKEPCVPDEDTRARFFLHVYPDDASDLPAGGARHRFENLDFKFADYGAYLGGICVAMRELPQYEVERVRTGQHVSEEGALWKARIEVSAGRPYRQAHRAASGGDYGGAVAQSNFDIYLDEDAEIKTLIYVKERCVPDDTRARFFLHIIPSDEADLPAERKGQRFDNLDFRFADFGAHFGEVCVAVRELPEYGVESVRTGQYVSGEGAVWRVEFGVGEGE